MSDVSKTKELIAEAREQAAYLRGVSRDGSMPYSGELLGSLADALEAATDVNSKGSGLFGVLGYSDDDPEVIKARAEAERDAALAAIERVRAVADHWSSDEDAKGLHFDLVAALDGAPEPEWEYGREYRDEAGCPHVRESSDVSSPDGHRADGSPYWNYRAMRRRPAGPWLPVEGESE